MRIRALSCAAAVMMMAGFAFAQAKTKAELDAYMAIGQERDPDQVVKKVDEFLVKYADTQLKAAALNFAANAMEQKPDPVKAVVYAQSALDADPKNFQAMLLISGEMGRQTRENDLDKDEKLAKADKLANDAIAVVNEMAKPNPALSDEQWAGIKKDLLAQAHEDLGLVALARKKYDAAIAEFKVSIDGGTSPDPATMVRLAATYNQAGKPDEAIAEVAKVMAMPNLPDSIKRVAQAEKTRADQAKNAKK